LSTAPPLPAAAGGLLCDQASASGAAVLTFIGVGFSYQGSPLVASAGGERLLVAAGGDPSACSLQFALGGWPALRGRRAMPAASRTC
jgi:hypothetical protein